MEIKDVLTHQDESSRNTQAYSLWFGDLKVFVSYSTVVGFSHPTVGKYALPNTFSRTTGRHYKEMGLTEAEKLDDEDFRLRFFQALKIECDEVGRQATRAVQELTDEVARKNAEKEGRAAAKKIEQEQSKKLEQLKRDNLIMERSRKLGHVLHVEIAGMLLTGKKPETMWKKLLKGGYPTLGYDKVKGIVAYLQTGEGDVTRLKL